MLQRVLEPDVDAARRQLRLRRQFHGGLRCMVSAVRLSGETKEVACRLGRGADQLVIGIRTAA